MCCWLCSGGLKGCILLCLLSWTFWCILWCCKGKLSLLNSGGWMVRLNGQTFWLFCTFWMFIWSWSWYQWLVCIVPDCFDTWIIFLWPMVLLWMVGLNGQMLWPFCMFWTFIWSWSSVPINSSHHADHFDTWLISLQPTVLLWMVGLKSGAEQLNILAVLHIFEHSYGADLGTNELSLSCWSFQYLAHFSMTDGSCTVLCISSNMTLPWVMLLAAGEAQSAWLVMIFALGGGTPSLGQSLIKSNLSDVAHESNVLPDLSVT